MGIKIGYGIFITCLIVLSVYALYYRELSNEQTFLVLYVILIPFSYVLLFTFYLIVIRHFVQLKSITYRKPMEKLLIAISRKKKPVDDLFWFFAAGGLINFLITFVLGISPIKGLVSSIPIIGEILAVGLENVGTIFDPGQITNSNYPTYLLPFSSIGFIILFILRLHYHKVENYKHVGAQIILVFIYSAVVLLSLHAYATYSNVNTEVMQAVQNHVELERLFGSVIIVTVLGSSSSIAICLFDRFLIQRL